MAERLEPPFEQPFRLALLGRDEAHRVLGKAGRRGIGFDIGDETVFVALLRERANRLLCRKRGAHRASIKGGNSRSAGSGRAGVGTKANGLTMSCSETADSAAPTARLIAPQCGRVGQ